MSKIISILNQKGGVGKTTTTINLAASLARSGNSVLIVDFDPQGNATSGLGLDKNNIEITVYNLLVQPISVQECMVDTEVEGLRIITASQDLSAAEIELANFENRDVRLKNALQNLEFDYIFIDCPPALGLLTINALAASDWLLIPVQAEYYALEGLSQLLSVMQRVKHGINPNIELLGVAVTMFDNRNSLAGQVKEELNKYFGEKVFKTVIPRNVRLAEAPSFGKSIFDHDKWSKGARAYKQLAKEVEKRVGQ